jgi:hypothetical protein
MIQKTEKKQEEAVDSNIVTVPGIYEGSRDIIINNEIAVEENEAMEVDESAIW